MQNTQNYEHPMTQDLLQQVTDALQAKKGRWKQIASELSPDVSYSFISQVGRGKYKSAPSYKKLKAIFEHLRSDRRVS